MRIATRGSALALAQARWVAERLPGEVELVTVTTSGDRRRAVDDKREWVLEIEEALLRGDSVVAYKFGRMLPETLAVLRETGRIAHAVYGAGLGLPGEDLRPAADLDPFAPGPYLATLVVPPVRDGRGSGLRRP